MSFHKSRLFLIISVIFFGFSFNNAYAYLDPASGSIIIQVVIAALVGVGITVKIYWEKLKMKFSSSLSRKEPKEDS